MWLLSGSWQWYVSVSKTSKSLIQKPLNPGLAFIMTDKDQALDRNWWFYEARNYYFNTFNVGNRAWPQAVIDTSDVSTTETSPQKYKQIVREEKKKSRWVGNSE